MESVNNSSTEFRKNMWTVIAGISCLIAVWKGLAILQVVVSALFQ